MTVINARKRDFYDRFVCEKIIEKYAFSEMKALQSFLTSETYQMFLDPETALYQASPVILFDMWENEQVSGEPRNSLYLRCDEIE
jgi:hypothetical protein